MKNVFFALAFMLVGTFAFASTSVESNLDLNSENVTELSINDIEKLQLFDGNFTVETLTIDLGIFGCTNYVIVKSKKTGEVFCEFEFYDEDCEGDSASTIVVI
ncbi:hypothetical protein [Winogradskyella sp.]|uniref:hypothetical protein n=1 Tax=Winogradskyella sp. TaxID=1883156 RepID=UPI0025E70D9E|nr:hypothetical protein [Winogradskyella sp.]MBT8245470.1 hypothetical protein [Winogradskyella sp.]